MSGDEGEIIPPKPARELKGTKYDLAEVPQRNTNKPPRAHDTVEYRSPAAMMRELGFDPTKYMTPMQFLVALMNDDLDLIFKNQKRKENMIKRGGIGINYRLEAAKTAAKYMHMMMPTVQINKGETDSFGNKLAEAVASGNERVRTKRVILETIERISPDVPLPPASYPAAFGGDVVEGRVIEGNPEGDTDYDPDRDE